MTDPRAESHERLHVRQREKDRKRFDIVDEDKRLPNGHEPITLNADDVFERCRSKAVIGVRRFDANDENQILVIVMHPEGVRHKWRNDDRRRTRLDVACIDFVSQPIGELTLKKGEHLSLIRMQVHVGRTRSFRRWYLHVTAGTLSIERMTEF